MEIIEVDVQDESARRAFFEIEEEVAHHEFSHPWRRTYESFEASVTGPQGVYHRTLHLAAISDGRWLGTAELGRSLQDNEHLADVEVTVRPGARRAGVGTALLQRVESICRADGRTTLCAELEVPSGTELVTSPGFRFGQRFGFTSVHQEDHLVLDLPVSPEQADRLSARVRESSYDIVLWGDRCPEEYVESYCAMRTQMSNDVPIGEIDWEPVVFDEERLRSNEERVVRGWIRIVAAARQRADGVMGGYSMLLLPRGGDLVMQDDTLVMPEHRGHRLGTALKLATLAAVQAGHPERTAIHTWTEPDNHAMQRTNADFGFRARSRMHELQCKQ